MSQADINAFVNSAFNDTLTPQGVTTAVVTRGIPVNGRHKSAWNVTALHHTVLSKRRELVVALVAAGADANVTNLFGKTPMWWGAAYSTADILQLLINSGGSVNEPDNYGQTPLIALVRYNCNDAPARLQVLLARPELDLDAKYDGRTAEEWAVRRGHPEFAAAIADERRRRVRWSIVRCAWIAATARA
jgi:ankyrin repeat protein